MEAAETGDLISLTNQRSLMEGEEDGMGQPQQNQLEPHYPHATQRPMLIPHSTLKQDKREGTTSRAEHLILSPGYFSCVGPAATVVDIWKWSLNLYYLKGL